LYPGVFFLLTLIVDSHKHEVMDSRNIPPQATGEDNVFGERMLGLAKRGQSVSTSIKMPMHLRNFSLSNIFDSAVRGDPGKEKIARWQGRDSFLKPSPPPKMGYGGPTFGAPSKARGTVTHGLVVDKNLDPTNKLITIAYNTLRKEDSSNQLSFVILLDGSPKQGLIFPRGVASCKNTNTRQTNFTLTRVVSTTIGGKDFAALLANARHGEVSLPSRKGRVGILRGNGPLPGKNARILRDDAIMLATGAPLRDGGFPMRLRVILTEGFQKGLTNGVISVAAPKNVLEGFVAPFLTEGTFRRRQGL
jgi:hypothetical protein